MSISPTASGLSALFIWIFTAAIVAQTGDIPPFTLGAIANFGSFLIYCALWHARGARLRKKFIMPRKAYLIGLCLSVYIILWIVGLKYAPVVEANLLNYLWPILLVVFSAIANKTTLRTHHIAGMLLGFAGTAVLMLRVGFGNFEPIHIIGYIAAFVSAFTWAIYSVLTPKSGVQDDRVGVFLLISAVLCVPPALWMESWQPTWSWSLLFIGLFAFTRIGIFLWNYAMRHGQPLFVTSFSYFVPLFSTLVLIFTTHSPLTPAVFWAGCLILAGCMITNKEQLKPLLRRLRIKN
jgi:drug/metabolite transporter (DMT)-like permease